MIAKFTTLGKYKGFIRYFNNTSWMIAEQLLRIAAALIVGVWVARYLGPEKFGLFSYALAFSALFGGIAKLGLDGILVRELNNHPEKRDTYLGTAFWLKVIGAFIVIVIIAAILPFTSNDTATNTFIFIIAVGYIFHSFEVVEFYFQSQVKAKVVTICKVIQLILSSIIKIYLVLIQAELISFVLVAAFDALSLAVSYFIAYTLQKNSVFYKYFELSIAKKLLKDSWPLIFSTIVIMVYMRIDQIMIKEMLGQYQVGIYSAALRLSEAFYFMPMLITASLFPAILNSRKMSEALYKKRLQQLYTLMVWFAVAIALPMTFLADWLITFLFGEAYQEAGQVLMIHIWASIFVFLGVAFGKYLIAENLTKTAFKRTLLGAVINVLLNLWIIPIYGVAGAALATLSAQFVANFGYDLFDKRLHHQLKIKSEAMFMPWRVSTNLRDKP